MGIFNKFRSRPDSQSKSPAPNGLSPLTLHEALETAQRAKRAEHYAEAAQALDRALALASNDATSIAVIKVNQAEINIFQGRWSEAEAILQHARQIAQDTSQRTHLAYILDMLGVLAQARGDWDQARQVYEQALETARGMRAVGAEGRALGHLADTYLRDDNASYAVHLLRESLPKLNTSGDIELSAYFVGRLGQALILIGQETEGRQLIERALRLSRQLVYRRYERLWSAVIGDQALAEGRYDDAVSHFEYALSLFEAEAAAPEHILALQRASKAALGRRQIPEAVQYGRRAVELARQAGDPAMLAQMQGVLGAALLSEKNYTEAIEQLQAAASFYLESNNQQADLAVIEILRTLGAAQAEIGQDEQAVVTYQRAIQYASHQAARLPLAQTHRDLGSIYARQHKMAEAIREWSAALTIYKAEKYSAQVARLHCDLAGARRFLGQGQRALKDYEQALMALNDLKEDWETRGLVLSNAANAYVDQGDIESAESFFNEAIALARRAGSEAAEATRRGNYGWFLLMTGRPQQAIAALQYALQISKTLRLDLQAAIQTDSLGLAQDALGNYPRALEYHQQALDMVRPLNNRHWENSFAINMGQTLLALNQIEEALPLFETALDMGRQDEDVEVVTRALIGQGHVALKCERFTQAGTALEEALSAARKADMRRLQAEALSLLSEQQAAVNQQDRASSLWDEAQRIFTMLHMPQARMQPAWLTNRVVKS